jgi:hypothetical protein
MFIECVRCQHRIYAESGGRLPPWCTKCGADLVVEPLEVAAPPLPPPRAEPVHAAPAPASTAVQTAPDPAAPPGPIVQEICTEPLPERVEVWPEPLPVPPVDAGPTTKLHDPPDRDVMGLTTFCIIACALIPLVTKGRTVPTAAALLGVGACLQLGRFRGIDEWVRVGLCYAITVSCWVVALHAMGGFPWLVGVLE